MSKLRKFIVVSVMVLTVVAMSGAFITPVNASASAGDLIKMDGLSSVYYLGDDGKRYVFPNEATYFSWYSDWSGVVTVPASELQSYAIGGNVVMRAGTKLVKITTDPSVYTVEPNGVLRKIQSEAQATALYGTNWNQRVVDVPDAFFTNYTVGSVLADGTYAAGTLVKNAGSSDIYYYDGTNYRMFASEAIFTANRFNMANVITGTVTGSGSSITTVEFSNTAQSGSGTGVVVTGSGIMVSLASSQPAASTYVRDTGNLVAQAVAPFLNLNFTAASDGPVTVNTVKVTRSGISTDSDLGTVYLYDGDTMLAENTSFSNRMITFNNSNGLFTVLAGQTRTISVKADIAAGTTSVSGIVLSVDAASDIVSTGSSVTGAFPLTGNTMAVGTVADLGYVNISSFTTFPATIDPGKTNEEVWRFSAQANDQDMSVKYIKMTVVGTVAATDLANFKLEVGGVQIGSTVASMNSAKEVVFDFTASPYVITSGQTKVMTVKADVLNGSSRAFKLTIRKVGDFLTTDDNYGVQVKPLRSGAAFTLVEPETGNGTDINSGTLTISVASDSPVGNVPTGSTGVSMAKFEYKANGEDIKVTAVKVSVNEGDSNLDLQNGKLYWNGSQVGTTDAVVTDAATVTYTLNQVIPAGATATVEYKADTISISGSTSTNLVAGQTVVVSLVAGTTDATGQSSLSSVATAAATGRTLTAATGLLTVAKNGSFADRTSTNPTGVVGATNVKVGSLVITAGSGEGVTVNQIVVGDDGDDATEDFGDNFQNLTLKNAAGTQLATSQGTLSGTAGADFTFSLSPSVVIAAGAQYVVDIYADILTGAGGYGSAQVGLEFVSLSATGNNTSSDAYPTATIANLQNMYIASTGSLTVTADADTPTAAQVVLGQTDVEFAKLKFTAGTSEDVNVNRIQLVDTSSYATSLNNVRLYNGTTMVGSSVAAFSAASNGTATWTLATPFVVAKGTTVTLTVKADIGAYPNGTSAGTHVINLAANTAIDTIGASSGAAITETVTSATGNTMTAYRTKISVSKDATSPSGASTATTDQTVLVFNVSNTSNVDNVDATVSDLALTLSTSGTWLTATDRDVRVYKNSITSGNQVGIWTATSTNALASVAFDGWTTTTSLTDVSVAAGSTTKFIVTVDTNEAPADGRLTVSIPSTNGIKWTDGITASIVTVDTLPLNGGTLTY